MHGCRLAQYRTVRNSLKGPSAWFACALLASTGASALRAADELCTDGAGSAGDFASDPRDRTYDAVATVGSPIAPAVPPSFHGFAQTHHLDAVFVGMFEPRMDARWPGNLKRYRLRLADGAILDAEGQRALDPATGVLSAGARSYWSAVADGADVPAGGAASRLPPPETRNVYTYLDTPRLNAASNRVRIDNEALDEALLGVVGKGAPSREEIIDFIRGASLGFGGDGEPSTRIGAVLRTPPVAVMHGPGVGTSASYSADPSEPPSSAGVSEAPSSAGSLESPTSAGASEAPSSESFWQASSPWPQEAAATVVYAVTDEGFLHAVDAATGVEHWAFVPPELLSLQAQLLRGSATGERYGIDGGLRVHVTAGGTAEHSRVRLYFGLGRGGSVYYGLDVTEPRNPLLLWRLGADELPGLGQSWSSPVPARMKIEGAAQDPDLEVLVLGGGYDPAHDTLAPRPAALGNAIYVIDAISGRLLWHGGADGRHASFAHMRYPIPADVRVVDLTGDGLADRWYAADLGGQVWRFDIFNGNGPGDLVAGRVMARLGAAGGSESLADARRFFHAPDVALALRPSGAFIHIGIGSGHRPRPNGVAHHDRFYALRDHAPFALLDQAAHDAMAPVRDAELADITDAPEVRVAHAGPGWRLELRDGGWRGEKVLTEARTFDDKIYFTTFTPDDEADPHACEPVPWQGTTRLYVIDLDNGAPATWLAAQDTDSPAADAPEPAHPPPSARDVPARHRELAGTAPATVHFVLPAPSDLADCAEGICRPKALACVGVLCFVTGFESRPIRTYWSEDEGHWDNDSGN